MAPLSMPSVVCLLASADALTSALTCTVKDTSGGEGGEWGSDWDTYYTEDESRTPYYVNRVTGTTQWEEPRRWWSNGKWIDAK